MDDQYFTIAREASIELKIKNSRFIGETCLVGSVEDALGRLTAIRKREHAATHHCYAYRVGFSREIQFKYADDGEPTGTAGKPIFDHLLGAEITNTLLVVTRYYGGTNLGTGGLTHAYGDAAHAVLVQSGREAHFVQAIFRVVIDLSLYDRVQRLASNLGATVQASDFSDRVRLQIAIRRSRADELRVLLIELTAGKATIDAL
jgi:uncharacterized YigZ family protein